MDSKTYTIAQLRELYRQMLTQGVQQMDFFSWLEHKESELAATFMKDCPNALPHYNSYTDLQADKIARYECGKDHCTCIDSPTYHKQVNK